MTTTHRSPDVRGSRRDFHGLLPDSMLKWRRPVWWQELAIIAIGYWLYSIGRNAIPDQASIALRHARSVQHLQEWLRLNFELTVNQFVAAHEWLAQFMDYYYATMHFVMAIGVMVWLFVRRPHIYRGARTVLFATTLIALAGFALYPMAPPRLLPQYGYIDTVLKFHTWGSLADPEIAAHSNQFAAMPSLHIGWSLWAGIAIWQCARRTWVRVLGMMHPLMTLVVIIATANHFFLDAVAGALTLALAFGIQFLLSGHGAFEPPLDAPDVGLPDPPLPGEHQRVGGG